ncbi:bifunctional enoyl-CoA hydratase/phosphate acetyltransferase [Actibacterium sp. 188UL27-1]|uniref:bifunctional enoyl-CoA hydratase/phosphate acetyltransferase n=1 Tax=Actibacterium sp. 188UL27-1 TaxID=2786961 RepID=UPI00351C40BE
MTSSHSDASVHVHFDRLLKLAKIYPPIPTAVVAPESAHALGGALLGADHTLITPILIGDTTKIAAAAEEIGRSIDGYEILHCTDHDEAAALGVATVREGRAKCLMKGQLHTSQLLSACMKREIGLRTGRRLSHVFVLDVPGQDELLLVSDGAINILPDLETKTDITQNAIDLALAVGIETPKVGIMSAVETVSDAFPATQDAVALARMADEGVLTGGLVEGPFAMDNAVNVEAARIKGKHGPVAGNVNVFIMPNIEAGNMVVKSLTFLAGAQTGGLVIGAACPIILTSRADDDQARLASCILAALFQQSQCR